VDDEHSTWERIIKLTAPEHAEDYSCLLLSAPPARAMACLENIAGLLSPRSVRFQGRLALGVFSLYVEPAIDLTSLATIRKVLQPSSGFVEVTGGAFVPGPERTGPTATDAELMRQLKQQLDPLRIFEPAIFVA
jgi:FAD/FMN-containing dehydrogenase